MTALDVLIVIVNVFLLQVGKALLAALCANDKDDMKCVFLTVLAFKIVLVKHKINYKMYLKMELGFYIFWLIIASVASSLENTSSFTLNQL